MREKEHIWRLEYPDGAGPYRSDQNISGALRRIEENKRDILKGRPTPEKDRTLAKYLCEYHDLHRYHHGFANLYQYRRWFDLEETRDMLEAEGLLLVQYEGPEYAIVHGDTQSLFLKNKADIVAVCSPKRDLKAEITDQEREDGRELVSKRRNRLAAIL